jgi:photosystem II stability/assembly factor-like uncharacterized protein
MKSLVRRWPRGVLGLFLVAALFPLSALEADSAAPTDGWVNVTSNLANMQSECGNMTLLSPVPRSNTVIAGIAQQGLWATNDGGASWQALGTGQGSARITNRPFWISYDPLNPARFYESGIYNGGGAFATTNGGTTFAQLGSVTHNDFISIDYTDPGRKTLLVGGHEQPRTVWKSIDSGKSWTNVGVNLPAGTAYSTDPLIIDAQTYLVNAYGAGQSTSGIFRTTDGGVSWTRVSELGPNGPALVTSDGSIYWAVANILAKSTDHGVTWSSVGGGFVSELHPIEVPGGLLVTATADTLMMSSDGGARWEPFGPQLPYAPAGVVYSENQKALLIWHWDCGTRVLPDAIQKLSYDFASAAGGAIAHPGPATNGAGAATVKFRANWVSPTYLTAGQSVTVHQDTFAYQDVDLTLSVDIFNSQGQRVLHSSLDNQALAAQQTTMLALTIPLPTSLQPGTYVVKTAALGPDGNQYAESESAGEFVATAPPPTPTPSDETVDNPDQPQLAPSDDQ